MLNKFGQTVFLSQHIIDSFGALVLEGDPECCNFSTFKNTYDLKFYG